MQTTRHNLFTLLITALFLSFLTQNIFAQPPKRAMERIEQVKKIKLLDLLELDEGAAEKFLIKYNAAEKVINEKKEALDQATDKLQSKIIENAPKDELNKLSEQVINMQNELHNAYLEKIKAMKSILDEKRFATFLVFESNFIKELRKNIFERMNKKHQEGRRPRDRRN